MSDNYRPDVHGQVEASWRTYPPPVELLDQALAAECPDCNVNAFVEEHPDRDGEYHIKIAHDETCPWLAAHEQAGGGRDA